VAPGKSIQFVASLSRDVILHNGSNNGLLHVDKIHRAAFCFLQAIFYKNRGQWVMRIWWVIFLVMGLLLSSAGRTLAATPQTPLATETAEFQKFRTTGFDAVYNMEYDEARQQFTQMTQVAPQHPAGYFYLATNFWLELLNAQRRLRANLYDSDDFYAETAEKVDEQKDQQFRKLIAQALERAEQRLTQNKRDEQALYYQGATYGLVASYEATVKRSFLPALRNGSKAVGIHKRLLEINPNFWDAFLTVGIYNYVLGSLPLPVKMLAAIGGYRGSKERGLGELNLVTVRGNYANDDARVVLIALYSREKRYQDVVKLLDTMSSKYPKNYLFKLEKAHTLLKLGQQKESYALFDELLNNKRTARIADLIHWQYGEALREAGNYSTALPQYLNIANVTGANKDLVVLSHLRAGQIYDLLLQREQARAKYEAVLRYENVFASHDEAKRYLKDPYRIKNN
jgi:tetratricopeptide (TPR) repeat protein